MAEKSGLDPETFTTEYVKSDYDDTLYLGNPHLDSLVLALHALGKEVWIGRRRMHVIEALMESKIPVTRASIEQYMPTPEELQMWKADRDRMIGEIFLPFLNARNVSLASADAQSYDPHKELIVSRRPAFEPWDKESEEPKFHPAGGPPK